MPGWYGASGGGGAGGSPRLGPVPNLFAATAEDAASAAGIAAAAATDRAAAEALRDKWTGFDYIESMYWESGSNRNIGDTTLVLYSGKPADQNFQAFATSPGWILPAGTEITWSGFTYKVAADKAVIRHNSGGLMFVAVLDTGWKVRPGFNELAVSIPNGDWLQGYDGRNVNIRLFFDDSGVKTYVHQTFSNETWIDQVPIVPLEGAPGADAARTDFSAVPANHIVSIGAGSAPKDSGFDVDGKTLRDVDGNNMARVVDIPTDWAWGDITGKPTILTSTDVDAMIATQVDAQIAKAVADGNASSIGGSLIYQNGKLSVSVGQSHPEPTFVTFAIANVDLVHTSNYTLTGSHTWSWTLNNSGSVSGDLTLEQITHDASGNTTTTHVINSAIAHDATTITANVNTVTLDTVGDNVIFRLKGTSVNGNNFSEDITIRRNAAVATNTMYWGVVPSGTSADNFEDSSVDRSDATYISYLSVQSKQKDIAGNAKVDGDYTIDAFTGAGFSVFLIPDTQNTLTSIINKQNSSFPLLGTFKYIAPAGNSHFHRYIIASEQDGSFYPITFALEE